MKPYQQFLKILAFTAFFLFFLSCFRSKTQPTENLFSTFSNIPGISSEEIDAILKFQENNTSFTVSVPHSIELFVDEKGELHGFVSLLCDWLTELFGITFYPKIEEINNIVHRMDTGDPNFGISVITEDRLQRYFMTDTITQRSVKIIHLEDSLPIHIISRTRIPRYVFLEGAMLIELLMSILEPNTYHTLIVEDYETVYRMLENGEADAFIGNNTMEIAFSNYGNVVSEDFLPLTFIPAAMATGNKSLEPIISIITKALRSGAYRHITELYRLGYSEHLKNLFSMRLTEEEKEYINNNPVIPFATQYMSYPVSFYNKVEQQWEGAVFDVLSEIERISDISFKLINDTTTELLDLMDLLENGTAYFMPNLIKSGERNVRFIWPSNMYLKDNFALLSKQSYPNIELNDIPFEKVGYAKGSAFADMFKSWFPNAVNSREYLNTDDAFWALDRGEINFVMTSQSRLSALTNYYEFSDYKANYLFAADFESSFGINKEHVILCAIADKALALIDTDRIVEQWQTKTYNYQALRMKDQKMWIMGLAIVIVIALILLLSILYYAYITNKRKNITITGQTAKLDATKLRIEAMIQNLPGMVFQHIYNPPHFSCLFVSNGAKELTGYEAEEMLGDNAVKFFDFIHPDDTDNVVKLSAETLEQGLPYENTFRIITRDGTEKWVWERSRVIEKNADGTPHIIEGYHTDVTERMRLQEAEFEQQRMLKRQEAIISNLPGMVFQCLGEFPDYPLTFVSDGCYDILGYTYDELVGGPNKYMTMLHPDDIPAYEKNIFETLEIGLPFENTHRLIMEDGSIKWVIESCVVTEKNPDGSPRLIDGYVFDVTKQRQYESAELASKAKSDFLATMSHEIRTPMNSIMGFADLASDSNSMSCIKDYLSKITDSARWLLNIINDVLDISKIESGKMELDRIPFKLVDVFSRCQSVILPLVKEKGLELSIYIEPLAGRMLIGDPVRLYQVLINLLSNAVKFTDSGIVKFSSTIKKVEEYTSTVYFEVKDPGIGMTPEQIDKIFEPFMQADSSTTREYGGSGLGLAISKNMVELMKGNLQVESESGKGSRFYFEVVFDTIEVSEDTTVKEVQMIIEKPHFEGLVLICDDNSLNQEVICEHLARIGIQTMVANNGKIAVDMVSERLTNNEQPFDLIFMDMFMPVMDGIEAATKIIALQTNTPIVAMTANIMVGELEKYKKYGMPDCLGKPFTSQELWQILLKYLTPISIVTIDDFENNEELQKKLKMNFLKNNETLHIQIRNAIAIKDLKQAHRLTHSLKANAGLIGKTKLKEIASEVEDWLKNLTSNTLDDKISILETELLKVIEELKQLFDESATPKEIKVLDENMIVDLYERLKHKLDNINPEAAFLIDELKLVPGTDELITHIENFDFEAASKVLEMLLVPNHRS